MKVPIDRILREIWSGLRPKDMPHDETASLLTFDGCISLLTDEDGWNVFAERAKNGRRIRRAGIFIPAPDLIMSRLKNNEPGTKLALFSYLESWLRQLLLQLYPPKPPKGWRLFGRVKTVLARST